LTFPAESLCMETIQPLLDKFNSSPYINPLKTKRRLLYLKTEFLRAVKTFRLGDKNQSVYGVSGTSRFFLR
jgi:hypothetical protein